MTTETLSIALTAIGMAAALTPAQTWGVALGQDSNFDSPLPCQWEGDTEQTPISLAESFPAEYAYLKAKLQPEA